MEPGGEYVKEIEPLVLGFIQIEYPSTDRSGLPPEKALEQFKQVLEKTIKEGDVAAVLTEPGIITGWGNTSIAAPGYLKLVRDITEQYGVLLILDEVGTGFSRCGKLFGLEHDRVIPDIITLAKGISNGAGVLGAVVTTDEIAQATYNKAHLTSTFGWTPLSCAAAQKTLEIHQRDKVWEKAATDGDYIKAKLTKALSDLPLVKDVRGLGLEIGVELTKPVSHKVVSAAHKNGLHMAQSEDVVLQLMPPLTIERPTLDEGLDILIASIKQF